MLVALTLGLTGSVGHCVGMCTGIMMLIKKSLRNTSRFSWAFVHLGRIFSYSVLGFIVAYLGQNFSILSSQTAVDKFQFIQGIVAIVGALLGLYFVLALLGKVPSVENLFPFLVTAWRKMFGKQLKFSPPPFIIGMMWGLLPCGLVFTALFTVAISRSAWMGALNMAIFGWATLPAMTGIKFITDNTRTSNIPRYLGAFVLTLFSIQLGLRGLAAFGIINHLMYGKVMLW
jgi:uncharacterized protein